MSEALPPSDADRASVNRADFGLSRVTALIPATLLRDTRRLGESLTELAEQGEFAFWLNALFQLGAVVEQWGRDAELPPEFWRGLAVAANGMRFPQFVPLALGKAEGRPPRTLGDSIAGTVVIHREFGQHWAGCFPDRPTLLADFVAAIAAIDPEYPALLQNETATTLARRFERDGCTVDPSPEAWFEVRHRIYELFEPLFAFIHADEFPESLTDERWSIVNQNAFEVRYIDGLFPGLTAKPWWA